MDAVIEDFLFDYKSGLPDPCHADQVRYYAALFFSQTGRTLHAAQIHYSETGAVVPVPVPSPTEATEFLNEFRAKAKAYSQKIIKNDIPPAPTADPCPRCQFRGLCPTYRTSYWRRQWEEARTNGVSPSYADVPSYAYRGWTLVCGGWLGQANPENALPAVYLPIHRIPTGAHPGTLDMLFLNAKLETDRILIDEQSEVFIQTG